MNERIKSAVGAIGSLFVISPTLEESLGISRNAADKPKRIAEALISLNLEKIPDQLVRAIKNVAEINTKGQMI